MTRRQAGVRIIGTLEPFWIPVSDFQVTPVLAIAERRPRLFPRHTGGADRRGARQRILPDGEIEIVEAVIRDWPLRFGAYPVEGLKGWGATARILG